MSSKVYETKVTFILKAIFSTDIFSYMMNIWMKKNKFMTRIDFYLNNKIVLNKILIN